MAEITKGNGLLAMVEKEAYNLGELKGTEVAEYEFKFLGSEHMIEYIEKGCGCTSAYFDKETNTIKGSLDLQKANGSTKYKSGETVVNKYVFVWLNDGQNRFIADDKKQKQQNPEKSWFKLSLLAKVVK